MSQPGRAREVSVGVTLMLALVLFASLILLLGRESRIFRPRSTYTTTVSNSVGLKGGSPVVMGGVQVGAVTSVDLPSKPEEKGILVRMSVDRAFSERIRGGSIASVGYITLLSGEKYVNISTGNPGLPPLPDGAFIPPDTSATIFETGQNAAENLAAVAASLRDTLDEINKGQGLVGRLINQRTPYVGEQELAAAKSAFEKAGGLLERMQRGEGTLGRLISDDAWAAETLGAVKSASGRLDRVLEALEKKEGAWGELVRADGAGAALIADLKEAAASLKAVGGRLEARKGLFGRLLNDEEYSERVATDLRDALASLSSILAKIDRGEGTVGALINDPTVWEDLKDITAGVRKSRLAKGALTHYGKKGAKTKQAPPPGPR